MLLVGCATIHQMHSGVFCERILRNHALLLLMVHVIESRISHAPIRILRNYCGLGSVCRSMADWAQTVILIALGSKCHVNLLLEYGHLAIDVLLDCAEVVQLHTALRLGLVHTNNLLLLELRSSVHL